MSGVLVGQLMAAAASSRTRPRCRLRALLKANPTGSNLNFRSIGQQVRTIACSVPGVCPKPEYKTDASST